MPGPGMVRWLLAITVLVCAPVQSFVVQRAERGPLPVCTLARGLGVSLARGLGVRDERESKRQARVAQVIRGEIATIMRRNSIKTHRPLPETTLERVTIVDVQMSPDLRSAKVYVSVFGDAALKRQAYAWLVEHARAFKYELAQNLSEMKSVPDVYFKETDMSATVDVISTIDRLARERREKSASESPGELIGGLDFDFEDDTL